MADLNNTIVRGKLRVTEDINANGNITGGSITGNGSGLTNLNASNISSGTLSADRLATSGAIAGSYGPSANATPAYGATFNVPYITVDNKGRVTAASTKTVKIPASDNTDTHYTNYLQIKGNGTEAVKFEQNTNKTLNLKQGNNVSISAASGEITISATDTTYTFNGAVSTIKDSNLTASRALISNSSGKVAVSDVTSTELSYLDGVTSSIQTQLNRKSDKTAYEWNKEFAAGSNGAISLGRYNIYDSQLTFDITSTTNQSISGKLVIATQNGTIHQAKVFGDASGALVSKLIIYQSAISNSRSWVEVFCNFNGWSKNKVHIYAVALNSSTVQKQMTSVKISNGVPAAENITSGDTKWTGTIVNDFNHSHGNYVTTNTAQTISGVKTFNDSIILPPKNAIMLGTGADGKIYNNTDFYNKKLDGIVLDDMTKADTDGYYCFRKDYHSNLTQYKTLTDFFGHARALHKGGMVNSNNTTFVGFGKASGYPWFGLTTYERVNNDGQLIESYGIMVRKGDVAGHSSAYIIDGGASTDKETRLVTEDEMTGKANVGHTHAISEITNLQTSLNGKANSSHTHAISDITNLQSTLNGKANASHTHTISQINTLQDALDRKQDKIEYPCSFDDSSSSYVKLSRNGTSNYYAYIQHGNATYNDSTTTAYPVVNVTFPKAFNSTPTVIVSFWPTSNSTGTYEALKVINATSTGFSVTTRMSASISSGYFRFNWIAIYTY